MGFGDQLANSPSVDLRPEWSAPIRPWLSRLPPPPMNNRPGSRHTRSGVENYWDGTLESIVSIPPEECSYEAWYWAEYYFPFGDTRTGIFVMGMSPLIDALLAMMTHPQYGDRFVGMVAQHWPMTWELMQEGRKEEGNGLYRVMTDGPYWVYGRQIDLTRYDEEDPFAISRRRTALSHTEILGFPGNMPGVESLEQKSDTFKEEIAQVDAVLGVISKVVSIVAAIAGLGGIGGN